MISYLTRDNLNVKKYDRCIANADNTRIYSCSWYLDIVANEQWDVLVLDDYVAVMPLPKRRKYFLHYIYLLSWSQQLGVFGSTIDANLISQFIEAIPKKFKLIDIFLNSENRFNDKNITTRTNYILPLNSSYEVLFKNFKKGRKSNIKQALNSDLRIVQNYNYDDIITFFRANKGHEISKKESDYDTLNELIARGIELGMAESVGVINAQNELVGGAFFLKDTKRITYLFSSVDAEGRTNQAMSLILNDVIKRFESTNFVLDFEGSMIPEIASFFRSFGAVEETYYHYKKYVLFG